MKFLPMAAVFLSLIGGFIAPQNLQAQTLSSGKNTTGSRPNTINRVSRPSFRPLQPGEPDKAYDSYIIGDYHTALKLALSRAERGDPTAQTLLGRLYLEGNVVKLDGARAALWFSRAAEQGDPQAQLRYGLFLYNGTYVIRDPKKGQDYVRKAAEAGIPEAYYYYGQMLLGDNANDERLDLALTWFLKGVAKGEVNSAYAAAKILEHGTPTKPRDDKTARKMLELAAEKDHAPAQLDLAVWLINGRGGPRDLKRAYTLLLYNAYRGIVPAQLNLARFYRDGLAEDGNTVIAAAWYMAAQQAKINAADLDEMLEGLSKEQLDQARQMSYSFIPSLFPLEKNNKKLP